MGIFSGIFGDSEKESKSEINVVNVYENKNNPQGRKIAGDAVLQLYEVENGTVDKFLQQRMPSRRTSLSDSRRLFCRKKKRLADRREKLIG